MQIGGRGFAGRPSPLSSRWDNKVEARAEQFSSAIAGSDRCGRRHERGRYTSTGEAATTWTSHEEPIRLAVGELVVQGEQLSERVRITAESVDREHGLVQLEVSLA